MQRLFWKFFVIIWFTMMMSIGALLALTDLFGIRPFEREIENAQKSLVLQIAEQLLRDGDVDGVRGLERELERTSSGLSLAIIASPTTDCDRLPVDGEAAVTTAGVCYRLQVSGRIFSWWSTFGATILPWILALVAAALAGYGLALYVIRPVAQLRGGLSALAKGQFDIRIAGTLSGRRDEIADLADDFDVSAARLDELRKSQQRLFHDVSHELRSPLSRLQAAIGILQQNPVRLGAILERMDREIQRIDGLVGEILTLARLSDDVQGSVEGQAIDVMDLLNAIVGDASFESEARGVRITLDGTASFIATIEGELIYRAIENVIRNAVKYSPDRGEVKVFSAVEDDILSISVTDQGPGVPLEELGRIFEPFSRSGAAAAQDGFGLGLAIAKQALVHHGGDVSARPTAGGFSVIMKIPRGTLPKDHAGA